MKLSQRQLAIFAATACTLILASFLAYVAFGRFWLAHRRGIRLSNMYVVVVALAGYCDTYRRMPPAVVRDKNGTPLASWRMAILRQSPAAPTGPEDTRSLPPVDLTRSWDDPVNRPVTDQALWFYCFDEQTGDGANDTNVFAVTGPGTAFAEDVSCHLKDLPHDTIVLIEVSGTRIPWAAPGDLDVTQLAEPMSFVATDECFHVAFADTSVWRLRNDVPIRSLRKFALIEEARQFDRTKELSPYRMADTENR